MILSYLLDMLIIIEFYNAYYSDKQINFSVLPYSLRMYLSPTLLLLLLLKDELGCGLELCSGSI